jgi:hypothetical protein
MRGVGGGFAPPSPGRTPRQSVLNGLPLPQLSVPRSSHQTSRGVCRRGAQPRTFQYWIRVSAAAVSPGLYSIVHSRTGSRFARSGCRGRDQVLRRRAAKRAPLPRFRRRGARRDPTRSEGPRPLRNSGTRMGRSCSWQLFHSRDHFATQLNKCQTNFAQSCIFWQELTFRRRLVATRGRFARHVDITNTSSGGGHARRIGSK